MVQDHTQHNKYAYDFHVSSVIPFSETEIVTVKPSTITVILQWLS